jgi:hypothetical protein
MWCGYYRRTVLDPIKNEQKVDTVQVVLGQKSQLTKFKARERLEQEIAKQNGHTPAGRVMNDGAVTFGWFVRNRFFPLKEAKWRPETAKVKRLIIKKDLIDAFDGIPLENFASVHVASAPQQTGRHAFERHGAADQGVHERHLC